MSAEIPSAPRAPVRLDVAERRVLARMERQLRLPDPTAAQRTRIVLLVAGLMMLPVGAVGASVGVVVVGTVLVTAALVLAARRRSG